MSVQNAIEITTEPTALYRLYNVNDVLLYVGVTGNIPVRFADHEADKPWWPEVTRKTMTWYGSRTEALEAESLAIAFEGPRHNIAGASRIRGKRDSACMNVVLLMEARIKTGRFAYNEKLPSVEELKVAFNVRSSVIIRALAVLQKRGLVAVGSGGAFTRYGASPPQVEAPSKPKPARRRPAPRITGPSPAELARMRIACLAADDRTTHQPRVEEPSGVIVQAGITMRFRPPGAR